jgi:hypothetical protein
MKLIYCHNIYLKMSINLLLDNTPSKDWSKLYVNQVNTYSDINIGGNLGVTGNLDVAGNITLTGDLHLDDVVAHTIAFTSSGTATNQSLNYYEYDTTLTVDFIMAGPAGATLQCKLIRIGRIIHVHIQTQAVTGNGTLNVAWQSTNNLPSKWLPSNNIMTLIDVADFDVGATQVVGRAVLYCWGITNLS